MCALIKVRANVPTKLIFFSKSTICWSKGKYFWQYSKYSVRKLYKCEEIRHLVYFNRPTGLVRNIGHIKIFLGFWAQLFKENLGTCRFAIKLEGTQDRARSGEKLRLERRRERMRAHTQIAELPKIKRQLILNDNQG